MNVFGVRAHRHCYILAKRRPSGRQFPLGASTTFHQGKGEDESFRELSHSQSTTGLLTTAERRERWAGLRVARAALCEAEGRRTAA